MDPRPRTVLVLAVLTLVAVACVVALVVRDAGDRFAEDGAPEGGAPSAVPTPMPTTPSASAPAPSTTAPTSPSTSPSPAAPQTVRVASFNVYFKLSGAQAQTAVASLLRRGVDVVGLQEWNNSNRRAVTRALREAGWGVYSPVGDTAVVWNAARYELADRRATKNSEARDVGPPGPGSRTGRRTHAFWASTVRLRERAGGRVISVTSIHHPAHVSLLGKPRVGITEARLEHRRRSEQVLAGLVRAERRAADHVFVTGDYNVDYRYDRTLRHEAFTEASMTSVGMLNAFAGNLPARGTLGSKVYDGVYADLPATSATVPASGWGSDHRPVIATYELP